MGSFGANSTRAADDIYAGGVAHDVEKKKLKNKNKTKKTTYTLPDTHKSCN